MIATPRDHGCILVWGVRDMVIQTRAVCIAHPFCVPYQTHGFCTIMFGERECGYGALFDLVLDGFGLQGACLIGPKQSFIELGVFDP